MQLTALYEELKSAQHWGSEGPDKNVARYADVLCKYFNGVEVDEISYSRMVEFVAHLRKVSPKGKALSGSTVNRFLSFASLLLKQASKHLPDYRPCVLPWESENTTYRQQIISKSDVEAIAGHLKHSVDVTIFGIMNATGCRVGEIIGGRLKPEHCGDDGYLELVCTKNGDDRIVYCGPELAIRMRGHLERGEIPSYTGLRNRIRKAAKAAGVTIPPRMLHSIRHKWCTATAQSEAPIDVVMRASGHRTVTTLMRYRKLSKDVQRRGAKQLAEMMSGKD